MPAAKSQTNIKMEQQVEALEGRHWRSTAQCIPTSCSPKQIMVSTSQCPPSALCYAPGGHWLVEPLIQQTYTFSPPPPPEHPEHTVAICTLLSCQAEHSPMPHASICTLHFTIGTCQQHQSVYTINMHLFCTSTLPAVHMHH